MSAGEEATATANTSTMYEQYLAVTALVSPVYLATIGVGTIGNLVIIHSYFSDPTIRKPFNFLITNLAVADFILCALFTPLLFAYRVNAPAALISISPLCEAAIFFSMLSISAMYAVFPLLAVQRRDVMFPPRNSSLNFAQIKGLVGVFWVVCVIVSIVLVAVAWSMLMAGDRTPKIFRCLLINQVFDTYSIYFLAYSASLYGLSLAVTFFVYYQIYKAVKTNAAGVSTSSDERQATKLGLIVAVVYTLCWTPFLFVQLSGLFGTYTELHFNLHACASAIGVSGSAINPILYGLVDPYYRARFSAFFTAVKKLCKVKE